MISNFILSYYSKMNINDNVTDNVFTMETNLLDQSIFAHVHIKFAISVRKCNEMCLCLGPVKSGKTFLMKRLQGDEIDDATHTVSTNGINLFTIKNSTGEFDMIIKEIGGSMAPIWKHYFDKTRKLIYVIDTSNLCQISAAGVLLYSLLVDPRLRNIKIALTLNKMDLSYRQMRNEALLMLQYSRLQKEVTQELTIFETSGMTGQGTEELRNWLFDPVTLKFAINANK